MLTSVQSGVVSMNAMTSFVLAESRASRAQMRAVPRVDPAIVGIVGCSAALLLALAAVMSAFGQAGPAIGGNVALILFAAINLQRPYSRFWAPALLALACTGMAGVALAMLPSAGDDIGALSLTRFGLENIHCLAQLAAMAAVAMAWSTAGRSRSRMRVSAACAATLAAMQMAQALHGALGFAGVDLWSLAIQGLFAIWLLGTTLCLIRPRRRQLRAAA